MATFEDWDAAGRTFDAVVAGQSWHWVDPVAGAAKAARVLRPGGLLAVFAHVYAPAAAVAEAFAAGLPAGGARLAAQRRTAEAGPGRLPGDVRHVRRRHPGGGRVRRAGAVAIRLGAALHAATNGSTCCPPPARLTRLPPDRLAEVLEAVGAAIDAIGGGFTMTYTTMATAATLNT